MKTGYTKSRQFFTLNEFFVWLGKPDKKINEGERRSISERCVSLGQSLKKTKKNLNYGYARYLACWADVASLVLGKYWLFVVHRVDIKLVLYNYSYIQWNLHHFMLGVQKGLCWPFWTRSPKAFWQTVTAGQVTKPSFF